MANIQNLKPLNTRTKKEQREIAKQGGIASGKVRAERKTLKDELLLMLADADIQKKISLSLIREATNGNNSGSVTKAFEVIRDTIGEKPNEKLELGNIDDKPFEIKVEIVK